MARRPIKPPETAALSEIPLDMMTPAIRAQIEAAKAQIEAANATVEVAEEQKKEASKKEFKEKAGKVTEKDLRITYPALAKLIKAAIAEKENSKSSKETAQEIAKLDDIATKIENGNINLGTLISVQKESNKALGEILKTLVDIKKEGLKGKDPSLLEELAGSAADVAGKGKEPAPKTKPGISILKRIGGGLGGLLGGVALDYGADKLRESGNEKLAAGASIGSSALTGAGIGGLFGPVGAGVGAAVGGAYGLYQNWKDLAPSQSASIKELEAKSSAGQNRGSSGGARSSVFPTPQASTERGTGAPSSLPSPGGDMLGGGYTGKGVAASGSAKEAIDFFEGKGWTKAQAIGIAANLEVESKFKTNAVGDGGKAYGIAQWHPNRQRKFQEVYGKNIREAGFKEQLEFVNWELNNTENKAGNLIRQTQNAGQAAAAVDQHYERSSGIHRQIRINTAQKYEKGEGLAAEKTEGGAKSSGGGSPTSIAEFSKLDFGAEAPSLRDPTNPATQGRGGGRSSAPPADADMSISGETGAFGMAAQATNAPQPMRRPTETPRSPSEKTATTVQPDPHAKSKAMFQAAQDAEREGGAGAAALFFAADQQRQRELAERKATAPREGGQPMIQGRGAPSPDVFGNMLAGMMGGMGMRYGGGMMRPPVVARTFPGGGMPGLGMIGGMLGGRLGGQGGGLLGALAGGLLQDAMSQNGNRLARSSTADQMYQRAPRQVIMQSQSGGGEGMGRIPKPYEIPNNPDNFVGNVEPVDAAKRFKHLFGINT
jgi:hypothetical protein